MRERMVRLVVATAIILVIGLFSVVVFSQIKDDNLDQKSTKVDINHVPQVIPTPDYKNDTARQIKKAFPNESLEEMIFRTFGDGEIEISPGKDAYNLGAKSFNWVFVSYSDKCHWDLGVYEFEDFFWFYVKEFFNSEGVRVFPKEATPPERASPNNDSSIKNPDESLDFFTDVLGTTTTCAGLSSYNNPYNCCWYDRTPWNKVLANCTFAAWEFSRHSWGFGHNRSWHDARQWKTEAIRDGYPVSTKVKLFSIAQYSHGTHGHVAWVLGLDSAGRIIVNEQNCMETFTRYGRVYGTNPFNAYIQKKNGQTIYIGGVQSDLFTASRNQTVWFRISQNYLYNWQVKFLVTFPSGGVAMVDSSYYYYLDKIYLNLVLNARGTWKIQAFYPNGDFSNEFSFYVN